MPAKIDASFLKRRNLGRYDTPRPLSQALADWAVRSGEDQVLEPSSGSGVVVRSIIHRLRVLGQLRAEEYVWACDIDPHACVQTHETCRLPSEHILEGDFLSLLSEGLMGRTFDCIVGNPPYVSLHRMAPDQRQRAARAASQLGLSVDGKASLWAYFIAAAPKALKEGGRLAMILPETILHADYARRLVRDIAQHFTRCLLVSIRERCFRHNGADERVVLLLGEGFRSARTDTDVLLHECSTVDQAQLFLLALGDERVGRLPTMNGHAVPHLLPTASGIEIKLSALPNIRQLADFVEVKIGVVTGANDIYILTDLERKKWRLPISALKPILPKFQASNSLVFRHDDWEKARHDGDHCWMLVPSLKERRKTVQRYLEQIPQDKRDGNRTFAKREPWYCPQIGQQPHAFLRYMGASAPRFLLAGFDATCTNSVHRIYFRSGTTDAYRKIVALSLHSSFSQLSAELEGRSYGSGVLKLEPSEARRVRLLIPPSFDNRRLNAVFRKVEGLMLQNRHPEAVNMIDEWLYVSIPDLEQQLPLSETREALAAAVRRRVGITNEAGRKSN